jgi:choline monooxygenase
VREKGTYFTAEVAGEPVVVLRDGDGQLKAFYNVCRHRGGPVARGSGSAKLLKCAYHGWTYGLDGALRQTPEFGGAQCFDKGDFGLVRIAVDTYKGSWEWSLVSE